MESDHIASEVEKLGSQTLDIANKPDVSWADVVALENVALNVWFSEPELRDTIHHKFTDALTKLRSVDHKHKGACDAVFMLHNLAMHPITARGQIDEVIKYSGDFGLKGDLTTQEIESLMDLVQKNS